MTRRCFSAVLVGLALAGGALFLACSAVDPNPPDPHEQPSPLTTDDPPDASDAAVTP